MIFQEMVKNRHQIHSTMNSTSIMKIDNLHNYAYVNYQIISKSDLIRFRDPKNFGLDTKFVDLSRIMNELWAKNDISVMAALICI